MAQPLPAPVPPSPGEAAALQPPHDILGLTEPAFPWLMVGLAAIGLVLLGLVALWLWRRRPAPKPVVSAPAPRVDPLLEAGRLLDQVEPPRPFDRQGQEQFFFELSLGFRRVVEARTGIAATDMTTRELEQPLRRKAPFNEGELDGVLAFLRQADMIKFASQPVSLEDALSCREIVLGWSQKLRRGGVHEAL